MSGVGKISKKITLKFLPLGSSRRALVKRMTRGNKNQQSSDYAHWISVREPEMFADTEKNLSKVKYRPLISIVVPCFNTPKKYVDPLIKSVIDQCYENWELCLVDGSTETSKSKYIKKLSDSDSRIKYIKLTKNKGIVGNTNAGIAKTRGDFIAFLDHDDVLSSFALAEVVLAINNHPTADIIYSDEDKLSDNGVERSLPFFKPDFSPDLLLGVNYITHFTVARTKIVNKINGLRPGFDGAQDYDFLLRATEVTDNIIHIPKILYHWRLADGSTAKEVGEKNYADTAGRKALKDAVQRRSMKADVIEIIDRPTNYRLLYTLPKKSPKVSIIIPFKDKSELLQKCVESIIEKSTYKNYEIILVSNNSIENKTKNLLEKLKKDNRCKVYLWDNPFNYSAINNFGRTKANGKFLILLNNDTEVITPNWIEELVGQAAQKEIGAVGPLLRYPDRKIQHAGVVLGMTGMAGHVFRLKEPTEWTDFGLPCWPRNYLAVTGACLVIDARKYDEIGGLDETFTIAGNDVALGISLYNKGYRNVYWPFAELIHYENVSVGSYQNVPKLDYEHSLTYYNPYLPNKDPYFNPNLDIMNEQVRIKT